LFRFLNHKRC